MKRGKFIMSGLATFMTASAPRFSFDPLQHTGKGFAVRSGESINGRHLKMKGVTMNVLDLKISSADTGGALSVFEQRGLTPKGGPPLHIHPFQDEFFFIIDGEYLFQVGENKYRLTSGDTIFLPRNIQHAFIQLTENARVLVSYSPAGKMERFFEITDSWASQPDAELIKKTFADCDMIVVGPTLSELDSF